MIADMPMHNGQNRRDVLIRQIREAIAENNRKEIIERLLKGRLERVRKGHFPGGKSPCAYHFITISLDNTDCLAQKCAHLLHFAPRQEK